MGEIYLAKISKRIIASLLDYLLMFSLSIFFFTLLSYGILDIGFHNDRYKQDQFRLQDESHLFNVKKENNKHTSINYLLFDKEDIKGSSELFLSAIHDYYYIFLDKENKTNKELNLNYFFFNENTLENEIFKINSLDDDYSKFILKDIVIDKETNKTYSKDDETNYNNAIINYFVGKNKGIYNFALTDFTKNEEFLKIENIISQIERIEIMITTLISSLIIFALAILLNKNGETLFMHLLKIGYSNRNGYKVNFINKFIKLTLLLVINSISVYTYFIPLIINILVMFLTKNKRSLVDIGSNIVAIDLINSTLYKDYKEMENDIKK